MTKEEAINLMKQGVKITHKYFTSNEWMTINEQGNIVLEDCVECSPEEFWSYRTHESFNDGYSEYTK